MGKRLPETCWADSKINKIVIVACSWSFILFTYMWWCTVKQKSNIQCLLYYCLHGWEGIVLHSGKKGLLVILTGGNQLEFQQISSFLTETYSIPQPLQPEHHFITPYFPLYNYYIILPITHAFKSYNALTNCAISLLQCLATAKLSTSGSKYAKCEL